MSKQLPPRSRLGRGLSSLMNASLPEAPATTTPAPAESVATAPAGGAGTSSHPGVSVLELSVDALSPNPHQPRRRFNEQALKELADSLKTTGMIQPVVARGTSDGRFELIAGERRWRAAKIAGLATLPVLVRTVDPIMQAQMALVENLQRQDLNPIERAEAYRTLLNQLGLTQVELAERLGEDRSVIGHHVRLLDLAPRVQELIAEGQLSTSHGKALLAVTDPAEQSRLAELAVSQGLNVRNLERLATTTTPIPASDAAAPKPPSAHLQDLEKNFSRQLGMRVQVRPGKKKGVGRLIVHFGSLDQFDDLASKLGLSVD